MKNEDPDWFRDSTIARWLAEANRRQMERIQDRDELRFDAMVALLAFIIWLVCLVVVAVFYA